MRALIMGGTSGIGLASALALTGDGLEVTVTGRDRDRLDGAATHVAEAVQLDCTDRAAVSAFLAAYGSFEHLVLAFSPGAKGAGPLRSTDFDDVATAITGKVLPYMYAIREAQVTASVVMISAVGARSAHPGVSALSAANGAIERIVGPLAAELSPVRVNAVSPGVVDTGWWSFLPEGERRAQWATFTEMIPVGRVATAGDVAKAVRYLVHADYVTGSIMPVDGGFAMA